MLGKSARPDNQNSRLALAQRLGLPAVTADRTWAKVDIDVDLIFMC